MDAVRSVRLLAVLAAAALLAGCATTRIDWNARVGNYTHDQALMEFGPPDKSATLKDGSIVDEWLTQRGTTYAYYPGGYYYYYSPWWYGPYRPFLLDSYPSANHYLRLIFGPDGQLKAWKRFWK